MDNATKTIPFNVQYLNGDENANRTILIDRLPSTDDDIPLPYRATQGAAGLDWALPRDVVLWPGQTLVVPSGFRIRIPYGYVGLMRTRSSTRKLGLSVDGTIDCDYRGEVGISLRNSTMQQIHLKRGERVAQMVVVDAHLSLTVMEGNVDPTETPRGEAGFGSTGR
jgi:dUTP pyrophosphatase